MIEYYLKKIGVTVKLAANTPDQSAVWTVEGAPVFAEIARREILTQSGVFGHLITQSTTPLDLAAAMESPVMQEYQPVLRQGAELLQPRPLPKGRLS